MLFMLRLRYKLKNKIMKRTQNKLNDVVTRKI